ncbi:MAG: DUF309 domain-containing protein [Nitrososphaerales archaeon]|nr:DUF309 domain-containing protein [Nitrososphaerales archaeon]
MRLKPAAEDPAFLGTVRSVAGAVMVEVRNPKWTSYGALEVDVFANSPNDFALFLAAVEPLATVEFSRNLHETPPSMTKEALVEEARAYFNSERYWESHENLEAVWRNLAGEEKRFVQGVILVCAAFVHHQKREEAVALGVLRRAAEQLSYGEENYYGIDVARLQSEVGRILALGRFQVFRL